MAMRISKRTWLTFLSLSLFVLIFANNWPAWAQQQASQIFITGSDVSSAPTVRLHLYAIDSQGNMVTIDPASLVIQHDGNAVSDISLANPVEGGTFTIFLIDIPEGVAAHIPSLHSFEILSVALL